MSFGRRRNVALIVFAVLVFLAVLIEVRARSELGLARKAAARSDVRTAMKHYARSLNWYLPFGSAETAAEELLALGLKLASDGRETEAAIALSRMRSGLYGARSLFTPRRDLIAEAEPHLAGLRARARLGGSAAPAELDKKTAEYLAIYRRPARPGTGPALAAVGGFAVWVAAVLVFIGVYYRREREKPRGAWIWAAVWAAGFILWLWGMKWA